MERSYEGFVRELREGILASAGLDKDAVYFEEKGKEHTPEGDRLFIIYEVRGNTREVCGVYTQELYESYCEGVQMGEIILEILSEIAKARESDFNKQVRKLESYEAAKPDLFIRLLNLERNRRELERAVFRTVGDIAMVLYLKVGETDGCITSVKVRREYMQRWEMDEDQIFDEALLNTYILSPPRIYRWQDLVVNLQYGGEDFMDLQAGYEIDKSATGNCVSTTVRTNGAVAVFLPTVAKRLGDLMGGDYYLAFTSIHEVMVHHAESAEPWELVRVLKDTLEEATPDEDFLSAHIYRYSRKDGSITMVAEEETELPEVESAKS